MRARPAIPRFTGSLSLGAAVIMAGATARALPEEAEVIKPPPVFSLWVDRGFSLPAPQAFGVLGFSASRPRDAQGTVVETTLCGGIGLTEHLAADASIGSLALAPGFRFHGPQLGLFYTAIDTPALELDVFGHVTFDTEKGRVIDQFEPGVAAIVRAPHHLRVDIAAFMPISPGDEFILGAHFPFSVGFQIAEHYHASLNSGLTIQDVRDPRGTGAIPAGVTLGYSTMLVNGATVGLGPTLTLPEAVRFGPADHGHTAPLIGSLNLSVVSAP